MRSQFYDLACQIAETALHSKGGISVCEIARMVGEANCYPGTHSGPCHELSYFISIRGEMAKGRGHLYFSAMLEAFIMHMQGHCRGITKHAIIITTDWEHWHYEQWYYNIENIKRDGVLIEVYLIGKGHNITQICI